MTAYDGQGYLRSRLSSSNLQKASQMREGNQGQSLASQWAGKNISSWKVFQN